MLILYFHWPRRERGVIVQCHIWPLRKTLQFPLRDDECIPRGAEKRGSQWLDGWLWHPIVSAPCYHVKHFFLSHWNALKNVLVLSAQHNTACLFNTFLLCVLCEYVMQEDLKKKCSSKFQVTCKLPSPVLFEDYSPVFCWSYPEDVTKMIAAPEIPSEFPFPQ